MAYIWECDICHQREGEQGRKYWVIGEKVLEAGITAMYDHMDVCPECAAFLTTEIALVKRHIAERREYGNA